MIRRGILIPSVVLAVWCTGWAQPEAHEFTFGFSAALGIDAFASPSVVDYINSIAIPAERLDEFGSAVEFAFVPEWSVSKEWSVGLDYTYLIKTYSVTGVGGGSRFTYGVHLPFLVVHYVIPWRGSRLKVGGGVGLALASFGEALYGSSSSREYSAKGGGVKVEAVGHSKLDDHFYGVLAIDVRWIGGETFHDGSAAARVGNTAAGIGYFSASLKFGIAFSW